LRGLEKPVFGTPEFSTTDRSSQSIIWSMTRIGDAKSKKKRKPSSQWNRRVNTVPLDQRGAFQLPEAADYLSLSITTIRRLIKRGLIQPLASIRHVVITRAECDRFLRDQTDIAKVAA
jgi:excisionase family DNA binding protein